MKTYTNLYFLVLFILSINLSFGQIQKKEFYKHLYSIDTTYSRLREGYDKFCTTNANLALVKTVIDNYLINDSDYIYISNRSLLNKIKKTSFNSKKIVFIDTLNNGDTLKFEILISNFNKNNNKIRYYKEGYCCYSINNKRPYGAEYTLPTFEISSMFFTIKNKIYIVPKIAYSDLFNIRLKTDSIGFFKTIELYESISKRYLYLYIYGGSEASTYFAKLIFSKQKFITRIIIPYRGLFETSSFRRNFIGI